MREALQSQLASHIEIKVLVEPRCEQIYCDSYVIFQHHVFIDQDNLLLAYPHPLTHSASIDLESLQLLSLVTNLVEHFVEDSNLFVSRCCPLDVAEYSGNLAKLHLSTEIMLIQG